MNTVPETEAAGTLSFHAALIQAEAQARSTLDVALHERLSAAVALVKTGRTFQASDGTWLVESTSQAGRVYSVNGVCACEDHHYNHPPKGLCKHRLAMFLSQRVLSLMHQPPAPVVPEPWPDTDFEDAPPPAVETAPAPRPAVHPTLPEAPASVNVRVQIAGREVQWTLRDIDEDRLATRLERLLARFPLPEPATAASQPQGQSDTPHCPTHGALKKSTRGKGWYCPHKLDEDTWCPSKGR